MSESEETTGDAQHARIAAIVLVGGQVLAAVGALLVNLLASRVLDPAPRGDLAYALQMSYFFSVIAVMGLERPYMASRVGRFNSEYRTFTRMVIPGTLVVIPVIFFVTAISPFSVSWMWMGALVLAAYVALNSLVLSVRVAYVASRDWKRFGVNAFGSQLTIVAGAVLLTVLEVSDPVLWMGVYALSGIPAVVLLWLALRGGSESSLPTPPERKSLRRRGWILLPSAFSNMAMLRSDRLLLPALSTSAELGLYITVATVLEMATWPVEQWVDASLRRWARSPGMPWRFIGSLIARSLLLLMVLSALLGVAAYLMIVIVLPESYRPAIAVIFPLSVAAVIYGITRVQQGILIAFAAEVRVSIMEISGALISVIAYVILIPNFGMLGAAYGSIIGYVACAIVASILLLGVSKERGKS
ncbi:lipopolysaccharide biosynthesis protein [Corynebacterium sp. A21]|uniref:lipopolysaccharide biosynthesis protein n=1 Tax=Corynebacterium sp. A21 TaxID=3457318 RepID=UPI003FD1EFD8